MEMPIIFIMAPGAFFVLAMLTALQNRFHVKGATNRGGSELACGGNCSSCSGSLCEKNHEKIQEGKNV
jgi:electron transport complex protein RnfE